MNRDDRLLRRIQEMLSLDNDTLAQQLHSDFNRYFRHLLRDPAAIARYFEDVEYLLNRGRLQGRVLDLASGFGLTAICLRMLGVDSVTGLDISDTKVTTSRTLAKRLQVDNCVFQLGDGLSLPFEDGSFDGVLIKDAVSHFSDPPGVWAEVTRVLRPGGRLVIVDDRNQRNPHVVAATRKIWEISETGTATELSSLGMDVSFTQMRRDYIAQHFSHVGEGARSAIADRTRGFTFAMLDRAVPSLLEGKPVGLTPVAPCVNPANEIVQERLVDPLGLARDLESLGFGTSVLPPVLRKRLFARIVVRMLWPASALRPALLRRMDSFIVVARKPRGRAYRAIGTT
jgi:SAM-dependent methyltransferase